MLNMFLQAYARLPLALIHRLGWWLGWAMYLCSSKYRHRIQSNLTTAQLTSNPEAMRQLTRLNIHEAGKSVLETLSIWSKPQHELLGLIRECKGWEHVERALAHKKGIIFLTPHLGCYEIAPLFYASKHPVTVLFRPPRNSKLAPLINAGRGRDGVALAPTNANGVRKLLKALKRGEAVGILPDQVPEPNEGVWANFFGKPAYTMTLVSRLAASTGATVLMTFGERLLHGEGYIIHISPLNTEPTPENINLAVEALIKQQPAQYLWSYRRYKKP